MIRATVTTCLLAALAAGTVHADCTPPDSAIQIPDGATASRDQMIAAQRAVKAYDVAVKAYGDCLQQQLDAKVASGADRVKLSVQYDEMTNAEVDKLQRVASKFNAELRTFKAKNSAG